MLRTLALVSMLFALITVFAGCPRTPAPPPPTMTPTVPGAEPGATTVTPTIPTGEMGEIVTAHNLLTSYEVTITTGKQVSLKAAVKLDQGKPTALRVNGPKGYTLVLLSEETMYLVDPKGKSATKQTLSTKGAAYAPPTQTPWAISGLCSWMAESTPMVSKSKPYLARV